VNTDVEINGLDYNVTVRCRMAPCIQSRVTVPNPSEATRYCVAVSIAANIRSKLASFSA